MAAQDNSVISNVAVTNSDLLTVWYGSYRTANFQTCILYIYSTNISTEYFKHAIYSPFFSFKMQFVS